MSTKSPETENKHPFVPSYYILDLHPPTHLLIGHSQQVRGAASKALAGIGGENTARAGDTDPLGCDVHKTSGVKYIY